MSTTILILGAGTGGTAAARTLRTHAPKDRDGKPVNIVLFEKEEQNVFSPSLLWLMTGSRRSEQIAHRTRRIARRGVDVVIGEIENVNPAGVSIVASGKEYTGDYMIIALGAELAAEHDLDKFGCNFYTLDGAKNIYENLRTFRGGKIAVLVSSLPFKCPAAPYEAAMLIEHFLRSKGLRDKTEIALYTPEPGPMSVAGKTISDNVRRMIERKGIHYFPEHQLVSATAAALTFANGITAGYDLLAFTPKHQCPAALRRAGMAAETGWVQVNRSTLETAFPRVYAIGDTTSIPLESGKPLPKAGVFAHAQAEAVARNIARQIAGKPAAAAFEGYGQCFLETGGGKAGRAAGNFYASPAPDIRMNPLSFRWHWAKVWLEKYWRMKYF